MLKVFPSLVVPVILAFPASAQQGQKPEAPPAQQLSTEYKIPVEAARKVNPIKPTPESIARGKRWYGYDCAMCHGENGDGKGDLARDMKPEVPDFRDPAALKARTDGELLYIMKNGKGQMPPENRGNDNELWDLVNYIRSFATKKPSYEEKGTPPQQSR
jgi:mono/diheme cytochrome c family protein